MSGPYFIRSACLAVILVQVLASSGCREKTRLEEDVAATQVVLAERRASLAEVQKSISAAPSSGKTSWTRQSQLDDLQKEIKNVDEEIDGLQARKNSVQRLNKEAQQRIESYLSQYSKP